MKVKLLGPWPTYAEELEDIVIRVAKSMGYSIASPDDKDFTFIIAMLRTENLSAVILYKSLGIKVIVIRDGTEHPNSILQFENFASVISTNRLETNLRKLIEWRISMETCPDCGGEAQHLGDFNNAPEGQPEEIVGTYECLQCHDRFVGKPLNTAAGS